MQNVRKIIILGAAGRDFHNFNVFFRGNPAYRVVAFTATQIPNIAERTYPAALCGPGYPEGIPVYPEADLERLVREFAVDEVVFAYSDVSHRQVMHLASRVIASGASFRLLGPRDTMLRSPVPVVAVVASRTGAGKSTVTRYLYSSLMRSGHRPVIVRHPMPYGRLDSSVQVYGSTHDIVSADLTIEEMEEYQPHIDNGAMVYVGVDYTRVLEQAAANGDVIIWDGGNNDMAFFEPAVTVTLLDPTRPGQEDDYFPGEANIRAADAVVIVKVNAAHAAQVLATEHAAQMLRPGVPAFRMELVDSIDREDLVRGRNVLVVEDGPSVTHGGVSESGGAQSARRCGARLVDPRPYAVGSIADAFRQYPHIGLVLPALGYSREQRDELRRSIEAVPCDAVMLGTPVDLGALLSISKPVARVRIEARDVSVTSLGDFVAGRLRSVGPA